MGVTSEPLPEYFVGSKRIYGLHVDLTFLCLQYTFSIRGGNVVPLHGAASHKTVIFYFTYNERVKTSFITVSLAPIHSQDCCYRIIHTID
jgi:hypothetical protein